MSNMMPEIWDNEGYLLIVYWSAFYKHGVAYYIPSIEEPRVVTIESLLEEGWTPRVMDFLKPFGLRYDL